MNITFYKNSSAPNKVGKALSSQGTYTVTLKEECSMKTPVIRLATDSVPKVNYAYIPDFGRYYFVGDPVCIRNGLWEIPLSVDVLESFKSNILNTDVILERQQNLCNMYLVDDLLNGLSDTFTVTKKFDQAFDTTRFVLTTQ